MLLHNRRCSKMCVLFPEWSPKLQGVSTYHVLYWTIQNCVLPGIRDCLAATWAWVVSSSIQLGWNSKKLYQKKEEDRGPWFLTFFSSIFSTIPTKVFIKGTMMSSSTTFHTPSSIWASHVYKFMSYIFHLFIEFQNTWQTCCKYTIQ